MENVFTFLQQIYSGNCIKFHRNRPSFVEDITENILVSFFWTHCSNGEETADRPTAADEFSVDKLKCAFYKDRPSFCYSRSSSILLAEMWTERQSKPNTLLSKI